MDGRAWAVIMIESTRRTTTLWIPAALLTRQMQPGFHSIQVAAAG
jgi:hypothetical protein